MCLTPRVKVQKSVVFYSDYEYSFHLHYPGKDNIELDLFNNGIYLVLRKLLSDIVPMETCDICSQFSIILSKSWPFNSGRYFDYRYLSYMGKCYVQLLGKLVVHVYLRKYRYVHH